MSTSPDDFVPASAPAPEAPAPSTRHAAVATAIPAVPPPPSRMGHFIQTYSSFLSSFVIGVAGLVATSIWQYRQSQIAARHAESEQAMTKTKADNDWRIARAEILAKNLNVLASQSPDTADQRFGVLLSLTRGSILDPELAVSYALELGKVNPDYMRSVLGSTDHKNYVQLEHGFALTCLQRFGVERAAEICKDDKLSERSDAISQVLQDEMEAAGAAGTPAQGPVTLLRDEREVRERPAKLMWLFEPYLQDLYERRQWNEIAAFESISVGAKLVAALVLATARTGELVTNVEEAALVRFHTAHRKWLVGYMFGNTCDAECRGKLVEVMLSTYGEAQGDYDEALRTLIRRPRAEAGPAVGRLHARLLWCQVDADDLQEFRDRVLVPALRAALATPASDRSMLEDLIGLVATVPEPATPPSSDRTTRPDRAPLPTAGGTKSSGAAGAAAAVVVPSPDPPAVAAWKSLMVTIEKDDPPLGRVFALRRATIKRERANPPPMIKKVDFCSAAQAENALPSSTDQ